MGMALLLVSASVSAAQQSIEEVAAVSAQSEATMANNLPGKKEFVVLEFDRVQEQKWSDNNYFKITLKNGAKNNYPWLEIRFDRLHSDKWSIAGYYELGVGNNSIEGWPNEEKGDKYIVESRSGWLNIACVGYREYKIDAEFAADDGLNYKFSYVATLNTLTGKDKAPIFDVVGDGFLPQVTFMSMGEVVESRLALDGALVIPQERPRGCKDFTFYGWTTEDNIYSHAAPTLAQYGDDVKSNTTYHAVFAHPDGTKTPFTEVAYIDFVGDTPNDTAWYFDKYGVAHEGFINIMIDLVGLYSNIRGVHGAWVRPGVRGIRIGAHEADNMYHETTNNERHKDKQGYITLDLEHGATISKVVVCSGKNSPHDNGKLLIEMNGVGIPGPKPYGDNIEYIPVNPVSAKSVTLATDAGAACIKSVELYSGGIGYDYYTTNCGAPPVSTDVENGEPENNEWSKQIENGRIVIVRGNEKYNSWGQKIR